MLPIAFPRFRELAFELRSSIWAYATALHIQNIADHLPPWFESPLAEGRGQSPVGSSLREVDSALRVRILDPYDGLKLRFEEDEFESFVDCLSISAVCREARSYAAKFCQQLVPHVEFEYNTRPLWSLKPPESGAKPIVIRNLHCQSERQALKYFFPQPTTLTVEMGLFKSAEHFVDLAFQFFGPRIQQLVMSQSVPNRHDIGQAYWADSGIPLEDDDIKVTVKKFPEGDPTLMCVTRSGELYASDGFWLAEWWPQYLAQHLLKINEIFGIPLQRLPYLEHIEVNLEIEGWPSITSRIVMIHKRDTGVLSVISSDAFNWP